MLVLLLLLLVMLFVLLLLLLLLYFSVMLLSSVTVVVDVAVMVGGAVGGGWPSEPARDATSQSQLLGARGLGVLPGRHPTGPPDGGLERTPSAVAVAVDPDLCGPAVGSL